MAQKFAFVSSITEQTEHSTARNTSQFSPEKQHRRQRIEIQNIEASDFVE